MPDTPSKPLACDRQGKCAATPKRARVIWHDPCQPREAPAFCGLGQSGSSFETSPNQQNGEVSKTLPGGKRRGGARNRASRESQGLSAARVTNLIAATVHANAISLPFTRMITIHWEAAGVPLADMVKATGRFVDLMTKALARHGTNTAWLWVHENGDGKGGHCHLLAYVPADLVSRLTVLQMGWLKAITGKPYVKDVIHSKPIGGRLGLEVGNPDLHAINLEVAFGYVCKGAPQDVLDAFAIDRVHQPGGRVIGRRSSTSQNIGTTARRAEKDRFPSD